MNFNLLLKWHQSHFSFFYTLLNYYLHQLKLNHGDKFVKLLLIPVHPIYIFLYLIHMHCMNFLVSIHCFWILVISIILSMFRLVRQSSFHIYLRWLYQPSCHLNYCYMLPTRNFLFPTVTNLELARAAIGLTSVAFCDCMLFFEFIIVL